MGMTRNDIHRTSQINPADYVHLFCFSRPGSDMFSYNAGLLRATISGDAKYSEMILGYTGIEFVECENPFGKLDYFRHPGPCHICGASHRHGSVYRHVSGECIAIGHICAAKLEMAEGDRKAFYDFQKRCAQLRKAARIRKDKRSYLREWVRANPEIRRLLKLNHRIAKDMRARFLRDPKRDLSERQIALLQKLEREAKQRAEERESESWVAVPVTEERIAINATVLSTRWEEGFDGRETKKALLKVEYPGTAGEHHYKLWGNLPRALYDAERGDRVEFKARIKVSDKDSMFGFWSRPTKALLWKAEQAVVE